MLLCAGMENQTLVSSYVDSAKVQWMYTWSFCSERGKHVTCCNARMMLLSFVSHLTKILTCMFFLIILAWMENQSSKQKFTLESKTAKVLNTTRLSYYPHHILKWLNLFNSIINTALKLCICPKTDTTTKSLCIGWFYCKLTESVVSKIMTFTDWR